MKNPISLFGSAFAATAAVALLTACSGGGSTGALLAPSSTAGVQNFAGTNETGKARLAPSFKAPNPIPSQLAYVSVVGQSAVNVYKQSNAALLYSITSGISNPMGLFVDHTHQLWVANEGAQNILVFPKGQTTATAILGDPTGFPLDVTVCANGTAYVSNEYDSAAGSGDIVYYHPGSTAPDGQLVYSGQAANLYLTCTPGGDVYTTMYDGAGIGRVVKYPGGAQAGATQLPITLSGLGSVRVYPPGHTVPTVVLTRPGELNSSFLTCDAAATSSSRTRRTRRRFTDEFWTAAARFGAVTSCRRRTRRSRPAAPR